MCGNFNRFCLGCGNNCTAVASKVNGTPLSPKPFTAKFRAEAAFGCCLRKLRQIEESAAQFEIIGKTNYDAFAREIIKKMESRLAKNSSDIVALNCLAFAYYARNDFRNARNNFQKLVQLDSKNIWSHNYLAIVYGKLGQIDAGIAQLKKSLAIDPKNEYTNLLMGLAYTEKGQYGTAAKYFIKAPRALKTILKCRGKANALPVFLIFVPVSRE